MRENSGFEMAESLRIFYVIGRRRRISILKKTLGLEQEAGRRKKTVSFLENGSEEILEQSQPAVERDQT